MVRRRRVANEGTKRMARCVRTPSTDRQEILSAASTDQQKQEDKYSLQDEYLHLQRTGRRYSVQPPRTNRNRKISTASENTEEDFKVAREEHQNACGFNNKNQVSKLRTKYNKSNKGTGR